jgi:hypothetical protein
MPTIPLNRCPTGYISSTIDCVPPPPDGYAYREKVADGDFTGDTTAYHRKASSSYTVRDYGFATTSTDWCYRRRNDAIKSCVPRTSTYCKNGKQLSGLMCYDSCRDGYTLASGVCWNKNTNALITIDPSKRRPYQKYCSNDKQKVNDLKTFCIKK